MEARFLQLFQGRIRKWVVGVKLEVLLLLFSGLSDPGFPGSAFPQAATPKHMQAREVYNGWLNPNKKTEGLSTMGRATRKHYSSEKKVQIILELLKEEKSLSQLASEHGMHHSQLLRWKKKTLESLPGAFSPDNKSHEVKMAYEGKMEALYQEIDHLTTQLNWIKKNRD
ncbi:MAG: transposase [Nitrospiraceae bacterium]|nr:transposase [Nitrospiraceae bacterium]